MRYPLCEKVISADCNLTAMPMEIIRTGGDELERSTDK